MNNSHNYDPLPDATGHEWNRQDQAADDQIDREKAAVNLGEQARRLETLTHYQEMERVASVYAERQDRLVSENERLRAALETIANGDPKTVYSPIGPLHAAGIVFQWEIDAKIARAALNAEGKS